MPHVSKIKLDKKTEVKIIKTLEFVLAKINHEEEMKGFILSLMTPTERIMLAKRLAIIILLREGLPEYRIANTLHVTRITVSRMQLFLEARGQGFEFALQKLKHEKTLQEIKKVLIRHASYSVRAAGGYVKPEIA